MTGSRRELERGNYTVAIIVPTTGGYSCECANRAIQAVGSNEKTSGDGMIGGEGDMRVGGKIKGRRRFRWEW